MSPTSDSDNVESASRRHEDNELQKAEKKAVMWALGIVAGTTTFLLAIIIAFLTGWFTGVLIFGGLPAVLLTFAILYLHLQDNEQRRLALAQDRTGADQNRTVPPIPSNTTSSAPHVFTISNEAGLRQPQLYSYFPQTQHCQHCHHCHEVRLNGNVSDSLAPSCRESIPPPPAYDTLFPSDNSRPPEPDDK